MEERRTVKVQRSRVDKWEITIEAMPVGQHEGFACNLCSGSLERGGLAVRNGKDRTVRSVCKPCVDLLSGFLNDATKP